MPVTRHEPKLVFVCVYCRGTVAAPVTLRGTLVSCPLCNGVMTAPSMAGEPAAGVLPPVVTPSAPPTAPTPPVGVPVAPPPAAPETTTPDFAPETPSAALTPTAPVRADNPAPARIQILPRQSLQSRTTPVAPAPVPAAAPAAEPAGPKDHQERPAQPLQVRALHPETGIDHSQLDRRESFTLLRIVAAFLTVGAICAAVVWALRAHASF